MENKYEKLDFSNIYSKKYKEFTPILNEYFSRIKADLNLSDEQINNKVTLLMRNVGKIKFGMISEEYKSCFVLRKRKIILNSNMFNDIQDCQQLFSILTHELNHAISYDKKNNKFGMYRYDKKINDKSIVQDKLLDEIRTEIAATRRVYNNNYNYTDDKKMIRKTNGYEKITAFSTVLQNCLGITEKEFIKVSENGRADFDKEMETKFPNTNDYLDFIEKFTMETSILEEAGTENIDFIKKNILDNSFKQLRKLSYLGLNLKMKKDILDNTNLDLDKYLKNIRYSIHENNEVIDFLVDESAKKDRLHHIQDLLHECNFEEIGNYKKNRNIEPNSEVQNNLESKIMYLEMLSSNKELLGNKYEHALKEVTLVNDISKLKEYAKDKLILDFKDNSEAEFKRELDFETVERRKKEKENTYTWDNLEVIEDIKKVFDINKNKTINKIFAKIVKKNSKKEILQLNHSKDDLSYQSIKNEMIKLKESKVDSLKNDINKFTKSNDEIFDLDKSIITTNNDEKNEVSNNLKDR